MVKILMIFVVTDSTIKSFIRIIEEILLFLKILSNLLVKT